MNELEFALFSLVCALAGVLGAVALTLARHRNDQNKQSEGHEREGGGRSAELFALLFLVGGHMALRARYGLSLWDLVLLDVWLLPLAFITRQPRQRGHQQNGAEDIKGPRQDGLEGVGLSGLPEQTNQPARDVEHDAGNQKQIKEAASGDRVGNKNGCHFNAPTAFSSRTLPEHRRNDNRATEEGHNYDHR